MSTTKTLWKNSASQSTRFCRPYSIEYAKEDKDKSMALVADVQREIDDVGTIELTMNGHPITVEFNCAFTMIDSKMHTHSTGSSSQSVCPVCGATPVQMNQLDIVRSLPVNQDLVYNCVPRLHAWIKVCEALFNASARQTLKMWRVPTGKPTKATQEELASGKDTKAIQEKLAEDKRLRAELERQEERIKTMIFQEFGIRFDMVASGQGCTNTGNSARRLFQAPTKFAEILNVEEKLIKNLHSLLLALSSSRTLNPVAIEKMAQETASLWVECVPYFPMPVSLHKLLMHGPDMVKSSPLTSGEYSETALESFHKVVRNTLHNHAMNNTLENCNKSLHRYLLLRSDPLLSSVNFNRRRDLNKEKLPGYPIRRRNRRRTRNGRRW